MINISKPSMSWTWLISCGFKCSTIFGWAELPVVWGTRESYPSWRPRSKTIIFAKPLTLSSIWTPHVLHANSSLHALWKKWLPDDIAHGQEFFSHMGEHLHRPHLWKNLSALVPSRHDHSLPRRYCLHHHPSLLGRPQRQFPAVDRCSHPRVSSIPCPSSPSWLPIFLECCFLYFFPFNVGIMVLTLCIIPNFNTY